MFGASTTPAANTTFGAQPTTNLFQSTQGFGNNTFGANSTAVSTGTANPPFAVTTEKEGTNGTSNYQSITCMTAYGGSSFEELRLQDYNQNRKTGSGSGGTGFGTGAGFGTSAVGTNSIFGATQAQTSPFGQQPATGNSSIFGASSAAPSTNLFGTNPANTSTPFGQSTFSKPAGTTTSLFGTTTSTPSAFGANANQTASSFGQSNANPFGGAPATSSFGAPATTMNNSFGSNNTTAAKPFQFGTTPATGFGQTNTATASPANNGLFGNNGNNANTGSNLFGIATSNNAQNNPFGTNTNNNAFGGGSGFSLGTGTSANTNNTNNSADAFGFTTNTNQNNNNAQKPFTFGTTADGTSNPFGASPAPKPFSFNTQTTSNTGATGTNLFGTGAPTSTPTNSSSLFGNKPNTNLFGNTNNSNQNSNNMTTGGGLFDKPATNSIFGSNNTQQQSTGSGLFNNGQNQSNGIFGTNSTGQLSNNQFNQSHNNSGQALQASVVGNAYGNNPLFASAHPISGGSVNSPRPVATPLVTNSAKKSMANLPHFKLATRSPASSSRLFGKSTLNSDSPASLSRRSAFSIFDEDLLMSPEAFSPRNNIKHLVIDRQHDEADLLSGGLDLRGSSTGPPRHSEVLRPSRERRKPPTEPETEARTEPSDQNGKSGEQIVSIPESGPNVRTVSPQSTVGHSPVTGHSSAQDASYWTLPPIEKLLDMSRTELSKIRDFKVGRHGYGQVTFNSPVDLSTLERLEDIAGTIVAFEPKLCIVYPDESQKPPIGKGLNVPATVTIENCFPLSKDKREPIRDPNHPRFQQYVNRLRRMSEVTFVDFLADSGTWIFQVKHF